ncbi:hypothetical protein JXA84_00520 [candidate division WOR-3 bacterium]|nr:hypothetical protein [candidate division WOR-3 bacterium]
MKEGIRKFENSVSVVSLKKGDYEILIDKIEDMKKLSSVECHLVLYPFSREISSKDFVFSPYEEYVNDILAKQRSAYGEITERFGNFFGLILGLLIVLFFALFKPEDLLSIESLVSVIGSYLIGKEIWDDIENIIINLTKKSKIRMVENYYRFQLEKHSTLTLYSVWAKKRRYGRETLIPDKMDFIHHSNSQTLRLFFEKSEIKKIPGSSALIVNITLDEEKVEKFIFDESLLGVKLSLNKKFLFFKRSFELFQSLEGGKKGCLDEKGVWHENSLFQRKTFSFWKIKGFISKRIVENFSLVKTR